jgi:ankyrin repeat protein
LILLVAGIVDAQDNALLDAIRDEDTPVVRNLLAAGSDANTGDETGATGLMYAAAWASPDVVRALIDAGADVQASSSRGATALMWATGDLARVRLLLDRGAPVNARMKDGTSALVTAARRGNLDVMRLLLARGAEPAAAAAETTELLRIAYGEHPEIRPVLVDAGINLKSSGAPGAPLATFPSVSDAGLVRELLDGGVSPNPRGRFPSVGTAALDGYVETVRALLDHGADPNARGQHEVTPLMMAAGAPRADPAMVELLVQQGADIEARDGNGRTALDWALLQGETPVASLLRAAGARSPAPPLPAPAPVSRPRSPRAAVTEAVARLQPTGQVLYERSRCISCHHQTLPLMAMALARPRGIAVDADTMTQTVQAILDVWSSRRENLMLARSRDGGGANELTYGLLALAEAGVPRTVVTDVAVANLASIQRPDGSWVFLDTRPPQADNSRIHFTAMAIRGLQAYAPPGLRADVAARLVRARAFIRAATPASTQDEGVKLLGLVWSAVPAEEVAAQAQRLLALQRADGGWAQLPDMASDAYATGQALYALRASGTSPMEAAYQRGVAFLLRTQLPDGSWFVRSRAFGFQPYFETGFPHGLDQFISASATAWAVIGLAPAL